MTNDTRKKILPTSISFATAGLGGLFGWMIVHPFNTLAVRKNLQSSTVSNKQLSLKSILSLYDGLSAGLIRQLFYATSRFGFYELLRDKISNYKQIDFSTRLLVGVISGGAAALISCPAEVTLVRLSNDANLPITEKRNYTGVTNAFKRIINEEGPLTFFRGCGPFIQRAMVVGAVQVGTYDQLKSYFNEFLSKYPEMLYKDNLAVFLSSMTSGFCYAFITMPLETAKNRMASQKRDPTTGKYPYNSVVQTLSSISKNQGILQLWSGFLPYYIRCGGHTVAMFMIVEWLRNFYFNYTY